MQKRFSALAFIFILLFCFASCDGNTPEGNVNFGDYVLPSEKEEVSLNYDPSQVLDTDTSWQEAYVLSYSYFDKKTGQSTITEGKCGKYYQSIDSATNIVTYLTQEDGYMLQYMLDNQKRSGTVTVVTDATIDSVYSGFVMLSVCDPYFPVYKNVTKVGSDFVGDRSATRYKQVETENGETTRIAYVWIDDTFRFASKCELYDAKTQELLMRWELLDFTQNVTEDRVQINTDAYSIVTE